MALDAVLATRSLWSLRPTEISDSGAPTWLLSLGSNRPALIALLVLSVAFSIAFAWRPGRIAAGLGAIVSVGTLVEAQSALLDGPMRFLFFSGAALTGWMAGLSFARWQGLDVQNADGERATEALAEQGAVGALAACYLGSVSSKLEATGLRWAVDGGLSSTIAAQHSWGKLSLLDSLASFALAHPWLPHTLAAITMVAQASAILLPFSRAGRALSATLLLSFHLGVSLFTPILFSQAMILLLAFSYPWPRWLSKLRGNTVDPPTIRATPRALALGGVLVAMVVTVAWLPAVRAYSRREDMGAPSTPALQPLSTRQNALLGGLSVGAMVGEFRVMEAGAGSNGDLRIRLARGDETLIVEIAARGSRPYPAPLATAHFDLFYKNAAPGERLPPTDEVLALLSEIAARISAGEGPVR
jgi:hypothetical protein